MMVANIEVHDATLPSGRVLRVCALRGPEGAHATVLHLGWPETGTYEALRAGFELPAEAIGPLRVLLADAEAADG